MSFKKKILNLSSLCDNLKFVFFSRYVSVCIEIIKKIEYNK